MTRTKQTARRKTGGKGSSGKPPSSSSSHQKSCWESGNNKYNAPSDPKLPAAGDPKHLPHPPPLKSKPSSNPKDNNPPPKPSPSQQKPISVPSPHSGSGPSPSGAPSPFPDNMGPPRPPAYGFHMLDRRTIVLADGSVRSYFALPPDYQDFTLPARFPPNNQQMPGQGLGLDRQIPMSPKFRDVTDRNQDYWNSLGQENSLKRKYVDDGERGRRGERDGFARQRQHLLQYGNVGLNPNGHLGMAGTSSLSSP